jgi:hypothetical protein
MRQAVSAASWWGVFSQTAARKAGMGITFLISVLEGGSPVCSVVSDEVESVVGFKAARAGPDGVLRRALIDGIWKE